MILGLTNLFSFIFYYKKYVMATRDRSNKKAERSGNTSRTSNQGRKFATTGNFEKRGNPEIDDDTKATSADMKKNRRRRS
jgi:hypothetical protein